MPKLVTVVLCLVINVGGASASYPQAQQIPIQAPFSSGPATSGLFKWDSVQRMLLFYRDVQGPFPAVRGYSEKGVGGISLAPLADLPSAERVWVWDVAATPEGGVAVAAVFEDTQKHATYRFLFYGASGTLRKVWDMYPYEHDRVAVDGEGNVYGFGDRVDPDATSNKANYPLLIKYSPTGKVLMELLRRADFPGDIDVMTISPRTGEHKLFLADGSLVLYVSTTKELFEFDLGGRLLRRVSLSSLFARIGSQLGGSHIQADCMAAHLGQGFVAQLRIHLLDHSDGFLMAEMDRNGSSWRQLTPMTRTPQPGRFLGLAGDGGLLFLTTANNGAPALANYKRLP